MRLDQTLKLVTRTARMAGFTLVEVLLAMAITAFVGLLAYNGLSTSMTASEVHSEQAKQIGDIQLPLTVIERDIRNAVVRPVRDEYGDTTAALSGGVFNDYLLKMTRRGWDNPRQLARGDLQRVRYFYRDGELWRESWSLLDRVAEEESFQRTLLFEGIEELEISFLDMASPGASSSPIGGEWVDDWDASGQLPGAIKIAVWLEGFGEVRRVFSIPLR